MPASVVWKPTDIGKTALYMVFHILLSVSFWFVREGHFCYTSKAKEKN